MTQETKMEIDKTKKEEDRFQLRNMRILESIGKLHFPQLSQVLRSRIPLVYADTVDDNILFQWLMATAGRHVQVQFFHSQIGREETGFLPGLQYADMLVRDPILGAGYRRWEKAYAQMLFCDKSDDQKLFVIFGGDGYIQDHNFSSTLMAVHAQQLYAIHDRPIPEKKVIVVGSQFDSVPDPVRQYFHHVGHFQPGARNIAARLEMLDEMFYAQPGVEDFAKHERVSSDLLFKPEDFARMRSFVEVNKAYWYAMAEWPKLDRVRAAIQDYIEHNTRPIPGGGR